ncbi:MAG: PilW family protein [Limisphaerales bacterium]
MRLAPPIRSSPAQRGFTVIELMLSVAIMTVIVIALYSVFDVTQRALRNTVSQVDALEGSRAASDLMVRDLEAATPVDVANTNWTSFSAYLNPVAIPVNLEGLQKGGDVLLQTSLQDIFFVTRQNDTWTAIGYWVGPVNTNQLGQPITVGRLYRFSYQTNSASFAYTNLYARFNSNLRIRDSQTVLDGVVHLRVMAYDPAGFRLSVNPTGDDPPESEDAERDFLNRYAKVNSRDRSWFLDPMDMGRNTRTAYQFRQVTVPAFPSTVELELGILDPRVVTRAASIPNATAARDFLARQAGSVHFFRHRIPLRNAPPF